MADTRYGESLTLERDITSSSRLIQTLSYRNIELQRKQSDSIFGTKMPQNTIVEKDIIKPPKVTSPETQNTGIVRNVESPLRNIGQRIDVFA